MAYISYDAGTRGRDTYPPDAPTDYPIYRTHDWLGRERVVVRANGRRYVYRSLAAALDGRERLWVAAQRRSNGRTARRAYRIVSVLLVLIVLLVGALWIYPPLLLRAVDLARGVVGPAPVAYVETWAFRLGTLVRQAKIAWGDTAPRWQLEGDPAPAAGVIAPTATRPTATRPTATPTEAQPTATSAIAAATATSTTSAPATPAPIGADVIARGGNLRSQPRIAADTVIGLVWPGDAVAVLERRAVGGQPWLHIRLDTPAPRRAGAGVDTGATGWISGLLVTPATPTPRATPKPTAAAPRATPTARRLPPTAAPVVVVAPAAPVPAEQSAWPPAPLAPPIADGQLPDEGQWHPLSALGDGGAPAMAVTALRPDPARPDIQVALVAIDLTRARLHMVAGTREPPGAPEVVRLGAIPADVQAGGRLLAAFNGGFKAIHGDDGMGVDGVTYAAPVRNRALLAVTRSGEVRIGLWGRDFTSADDLLAWRQNGYMLLDGGNVTERARANGLGWGASVDMQAETWRSGVGLSADGHTLIYAVGDALTAARLAEVLRAAGAANALQLDINNYMVRFVTYQAAENGAVARPLISAMPKEPTKYLAPEERDFMYLTAR